MTIRPATPADIGDIRALVHGLAEYERLTQHMVATDADLRVAFFGPSPKAHALRVCLGIRGSGPLPHPAAHSSILTWARREAPLLRNAVRGLRPRGWGSGPEPQWKCVRGRISKQTLMIESDGEAAGVVVYFYNFSTFAGRAGIYVEDIYVKPELRGRGLGGAAFRYLAKKAVAEGCGRMEWSALDWNEPSIRFYRGLGAEAMTAWIGQRLSGHALAKLAEE